MKMASRGPILPGLSHVSRNCLMDIQKRKEGRENQKEVDIFIYSVIYYVINRGPDI